jgi:hypothetical protein
MPIINNNLNYVRKIKRSQSTNRGKIHTEKNINKEVWFESLREEGALSQLIHDPNCVKVESQSITIPNIKINRHPYIPDIYAEFKDGKRYIFDVKDLRFFEEIKNLKSFTSKIYLFPSLNSA